MAEDVSFLYNAREERIHIFQNSRQLWESNEKLQASVRDSLEHQKFWAEGQGIETPAPGIYDKPAEIIVSRKRSLEAAQGYPGKRVCVLNFASATNPGGGVEKGSSAQEEAICRCSTLYPCISASEMKNQFHRKHQSELQGGRMTVLYNDDCIFTPGVTVFKTDTARPETMPEADWYQIDVISCAAPNLRSRPSNRMNPGSGTKAVSLKHGELTELHRKRLRRILDIARANGEEVMILGAFGCGAFCNPPEAVAEAMAEVLSEYSRDFIKVEFAVYCSPGDTRNYEVFRRRLSGKTGRAF